MCFHDAVDTGLGINLTGENLSLGHLPPREGVDGAVEEVISR
jgi:hypothetical protein